MLKGDIFDKRSFEHLMSASDIGTHYLYLLYMIRTLNDENRGGILMRDVKYLLILQGFVQR